MKPSHSYWILHDKISNALTQKGHLLAYPTSTVTSGFLSNQLLVSISACLKKKIHRGPFSVWNINKQRKKFKFAFHEIFLRRVSHLRPRRLVCVALLSFVLISLKSSLIRSIPRLVALPSPPLQTLAHLPRPGGARSRGPLIQINRRRARSLTSSCPCDAVNSHRDGKKYIYKRASTGLWFGV